LRLLRLAKRLRLLRLRLGERLRLLLRQINTSGGGGNRALKASMASMELFDYHLTAK
jgi:hypothetical protein